MSSDSRLPSSANEDPRVLSLQGKSVRSGKGFQAEEATFADHLPWGTHDFRNFLSYVNPEDDTQIIVCLSFNRRRH